MDLYKPNMTRKEAILELQLADDPTEFDKAVDYALYALHTDIPLPDNATNGDVIKALFPRTKCVERNGIIETDIDEGTLFNLEWWNAPYTRGQTE